jgi:glyoxylase-like metal-dependent hydrolase (beta-lactamase superfamily II)
MQEIKPGIYYENGYPGVTLGALTPERGTILIDAPLRPEDSRSWRATLHNRSSGMERILIYMDAHPDRTIGARALESTVIAHQYTALVFGDRPTTFKGQNPDIGAEWETCDDLANTRWAQPDITFTKQMCLNWGDKEIILEHHPGPAPGAIWVIIPQSQVMFIGDAVLVNQPPFLENADLYAWMDAVELLLSPLYKRYIFISGREGPVSHKDIQTQRHYLKKITDALEKLAQRGALPDDTQDLIPDLLKKLSFSVERKALYAQRLRYGLHNYYTNFYGPKEMPLVG